jgi:hypothetical protein
MDDAPEREAEQPGHVLAYGEDGQPLTADPKRMVIVADLP